LRHGTNGRAEDHGGKDFFRILRDLFGSLADHRDRLRLCSDLPPPLSPFPRRAPPAGLIRISARPRQPALVSDLFDDRQFTCPALRRREVCIAISAALIAVLGFAIFVHLSLLASMRPDVVSVFFRALALSGMLAIVPVSLLWLLERRERQT